MVQYHKEQSEGIVNEISRQGTDIRMFIVLDCIKS